MRRAVLVSLVGAVAAAMAAPAVAYGPGGHPTKPAGTTLTGAVPCIGDGTAREVSYRFDGVPTYATYAAPKKRPTSVVVFAHGYGHSAKSWRRHAAWAAARGAVAVAPTYYRSTETPNGKGNTIKPSIQRGWRVQEGAAEMVAFARDLRARCKVQQVVIFGVSMGGNSSGLAVAMAGAQRAASHGLGTPVFDWWIDVEPVTDVPQMYTAARAAAVALEFAANARDDIEQEFGGTLEQKPAAYRNASPIERVDDIAASGVRGVSIVHAVGDATVPYVQARELQLRLGQVGVPAHLTTILTRAEGTESDSSADAAVLGPLGAPFGPFLAGHASETRSDDHLVMRESLGQLDALLSKRAFLPPGDTVVDGQTGTYRRTTVG